MAPPIYIGRRDHFCFRTLHTFIKIPFLFVLGLSSPTSSKEYVDFTLLDHYSNLYSKCLINLAERAVKRMKDDNGSIIFISSPGCNITQSVTKGYDMPGIKSHLK